jgi:hypothetical protein
LEESVFREITHLPPRYYNNSTQPKDIVEDNLKFNENDLADINRARYNNQPNHIYFTMLWDLLPPLNIQEGDKSGVEINPLIDPPIAMEIQ